VYYWSCLEEAYPGLVGHVHLGSTTYDRDCSEKEKH
jgi:hypothetical protein